MHQKALFIFRRCLRIHDNRGLLYALEHAKEVVCFFIFTPEQIEENPYRSDFCLQFMLDSLKELEEEIAERGGKLFYGYGPPQEVVAKAIARLAIDLVVVNRDYTPYSTHRDQTIEKVCKEQGALFKSFDDLLLQPPETLLKANGTPYTVFTPFYKNGVKFQVDLPRRNNFKNYFNGVVDFAKESSILDEILPQKRAGFQGGRREALKILERISDYSAYEKERDFPAIEGTTHLSAHLKFTTVSAREVYHAVAKSLGADHGLIRSLYWRDFFSSIALHFPHVFKGPFHQKFNRLEWEENEDGFKRWCEGRTGFPIIDAGMRQLKEKGYMHNRVRMIVASFLVKDLHIDWRRGERYFAQHLIDYDPALNNGNWQWSASTGCDSQPYFRIFNPWSQQAKFDPDCTYIKEWIPELRCEEVETIHHWYQEKRGTKYPPPIVDHQLEAKKALTAYQQLY